MDLETVKRSLEKGNNEDEKNIGSTIERMPPRSFERFMLQGLNVDLIEPGRLICSMKLSPRLLNSWNFLNGGATASLVGLVCTAVMYTVVAHKTVVTLEFNISLLEAAYSHEEIEIEARVIRVGKTVGVVSIELRKKKTSKIVAQGRCTCYLANAIASKM